MGTFADILSKKVEEIERPEPYPIGGYEFVVNGLPKMNEVGDNQAKVIEFSLNLTAPMEDVDQADFQAYVAKFGPFPKAIRYSFFIESQDGSPNVWRLKQFLVETLKLPDTGKLEELINMAPNRRGGCRIGHKPSKTGMELFAQIENTFAL